MLQKKAGTSRVCVGDVVKPDTEPDFVNKEMPMGMRAKPFQA